MRGANAKRIHSATRTGRDDTGSQDHRNLNSASSIGPFHTSTVSSTWLPIKVLAGGYPLVRKEMRSLVITTQ